MNEWTKCSERLPEESGNYLTYTDWGWISVNRFSAVWQKWNIHDSNTDKDWVDKMAMEDITHWMPLPAGPEE